MLFVWNSFVCFALRFWCLCFCSVCFFREYRNLALVVLASVEVNDTVCESVESIVFTLCYVFTWVVLVTALAYDNIACDNLLTTSDFNT